MSLELYKQAVRLIKIAEEINAPQPTYQELFYSKPWTSGVVPYPQEDVDVTNWNAVGFPKEEAKRMQEDHNSGKKNYRSGRVISAYKSRMQPVSLESLSNPTPEQQKNFDRYGIDFQDPRVQQLGNDADTYVFDETRGTNYTHSSNAPDSINYSHYWGVPHTTADVLADLAHETAHRNAKYTRDTRYDTKDQLSSGNHDYGYYGNEWPAIINEWTYGQAPGTIHPVQIQTRWGGRKPFRALSNIPSKTDAYYNNLMPLVNMADLKSEPGRVYRYWRGPGEPAIPSNTPKRLVYETPNGYWVDPEGNWVQTGADVFDSAHLPLNNNTNIAYLTPNLQRFVDNMDFLRFAQPGRDRGMDIVRAEETLRDLLSVLALRRQYRGSEGRTLADMLRNTVGFIDGMNTTRNTEWYDRKSRLENEPDWPELEKLINEKYDLRTKYALDEYNTNNPSKPMYGKIPGFSSYMEVPKIIEEKPWWSPDAVKYPMIPELAEMQKKYSISPTMDEPTDVRDLIQLQAMIDEAVQIYQRQRDKEMEEGLKKDPNWQEDPKDPRWLLLDSLMNPPEE